MTKRELPKHVYRQRNGLYFQRRGWPSQKFSNDFGTPEFWQEYADILNGDSKPIRVISRNFNALIKSYHNSPRYKRLKPRTALDYDKYLKFFRSRMGDANPSVMKRKDVIRLRDANAEKIYFANYSLRVLRVLMEHCVDLGWRETNPAKGVPEFMSRGERTMSNHSELRFTSRFPRLAGPCPASFLRWITQKTATNLSLLLPLCFRTGNG